MTKRPLLVVGLDGFDHGIARRLLVEGRLPHLARLDGSCARFALEHVIEKYTGLAWEQCSSGIPPAEAQRWSEVSIDTRRYVPHQHLTRLAPFTNALQAATVVFDVPYFNLAAA